MVSRSYFPDEETEPQCDPNLLMGQPGDKSLPPFQAVTYSWDIHKPDHLCFLAMERIKTVGAGHSRPGLAARFSAARHGRQPHTH